MAASSSVDVAIVGGGHNGLVAAAYLARAGLTVTVLERRAELGGAAVSSQAFTGVDARLSRYSYLVSLLPRKIRDDLDIGVRLLRRRVSSYTPVIRDGVPTGLLIDEADPARTAASFLQVTGSSDDHRCWQRFSSMTARVAQRVFPTLTEPLPSKEQLRETVADDAAWDALFERPLATTLEKEFGDDTVRGMLLTDALIGTFASADDASLRQNRCLLYHVIGNGTGDWLVPEGGMGTLTTALADAARRLGATLCPNTDVMAVDPDGAVSYRQGSATRTLGARFILANVAPHALAGLIGTDLPGPQPEGAQLKVNMVLRRLPKLAEKGVDPADAFSGTLHVNEGYQQLATAYAEADAGRIPAVPPCEIYCHTLTDSSILGERERASGTHTLTLFGLHMPARLFVGDNKASRTAALRATLASLNTVLAEPIEDCLATDADGNPCIEAKTPLDLQHELGLPAGHIFHRDLAWPYAATSEQVGTWGVETEHEKILLCGAGAIRGGGVSGIGGHNAAMAVLNRW